MKTSVIFVIVLLLYVRLSGQGLQPDSSSSLPAFKSIVDFYNKSLSEQLHLYNGKEYKDYPYQFNEGHPYFLSNNWSKGTLNYDGEHYEEVPMLYDVVQDELVILHFDNRSKICLVKEKISSFSLLAHSFVNIQPKNINSSTITEGFYDLLYAGQVSLFAKRTKNIQTFYRQSVSEIKIFKKDHYNLLKKNIYYPVSSKRSFLQQLTDKRKEIQQYIKKNRLSFKNDVENAMVKILAYYDQIMN
ncbi:MAG: hypothetical protein M3O67_09280, partial [Bacteroidota bacterium]|nr:hypothetical protein [Bacteroidota bacterium]